MRVISQNERLDLPYENIVVEIMDSVIVAYTPMTNPLRMAQYKSQEKAEKAMQMLHKIYVKAPLENEAKEMGEFVRGTFKAIGTSGYVDPESNYFVFRFPREDEI